MEQKQNSNKFINWLKTSITARMLTIGFLILVLLIPLIYIENLIRERSNRQHSVINEINQQWGNEVLVHGPILKIPYKTFKEKTITDAKTKAVYTETEEEIETAYFFPEQLQIKSTINPEEKHRGIYTSAVYKSGLSLSGRFTTPDFSSIEIENKHIIWKKAQLIIKTSNLKGINESQVMLNNKIFEVTSNYKGKKSNDYTDYVTLHELETKPLNNDDINLKKGLQFDIMFNIKGSKQLRFIPIGKQTEAHIVSNWKDPNFIGEFIPYNDDKLTENGFDAKWKILSISRAFSQQYFGYLPNLQEFASGVEFWIPVDQYQQSERSAKYGFLVIALTFLIFFLIQTISKIYVHPFQYLMIGLALIMFYTLLISISEHSNFSKAYLIAGISVISLITLYSKSILKNIRFPILIGLSLTALYTFIYVIIQLENYALLVGSIGLFIILTMVMYVSRKIDWNHG